MEKTIDVSLNENGRAICAERTESFQKDDPNLWCKPSGLPRQGATPYPLKIMQTPDEFVILYDGRPRMPLSWRPERLAGLHQLHRHFRDEAPDPLRHLQHA